MSIVDSYRIRRVQDTDPEAGGKQMNQSEMAVMLTDLSKKRTELARENNRMAKINNLLAYTRTLLVGIGFIVAMFKLYYIP